MRRALATALTVPALLLAGCTDDGGSDSTPTRTTATSAEPTNAAEAAEETATETTEPVDDTAPTTGDGTATTQDPGEVEGGEDGQAAADVAKAFFVASVEASPAACDHLISFTDPEVPMVDVESDLELCREVLPAAMTAEIEGQELGDEEQAQILDAMRITGAQVDGDTAVVDADNLSELFKDTLGDEVITLKRIAGTWYVDLDNSFQPAQP